MTNVHRFTPGQLYQGADEEISYTVNVGNWATTPTGASIVIKRSGSDVSGSHRSSATCQPTISTCFLTTPCIIDLVAGNDYRVELKFTQSGEIFEGYFILTGVT